MNPRRAIYPGSFDPITLGHVDLVRRAARLFDEVVLAVYEGSEKAGAFFTPAERIAMARTVLDSVPETNIRIDSFSGLTVSYARSMDAGVIVRGLRAVSDFEYEFKLAHMNAHLAPDIEVVCLMTSSGHSFISSSLIREVAALGGEIDGLVPKPVEVALREKLLARSGAQALTQDERSTANVR